MKSGSSHLYKLQEENMPKPLLFSCFEANLEPYKCRTCPNLKSNLLIALKQHTKNVEAPNIVVKLYKCESCGFETWSMYLITEHQKFNKCEETQTQEHHILDKTETKNYTNEKIGKSFGQNRAQFFKCGYCEFRTINEKDVSSHFLREHTSQIKRFKCLQCPYEAYFKHSLLKHQSDRHSDPLETGMDKKLLQKHANDTDLKSQHALLKKQHDALTIQHAALKKQYPDLKRQHENLKSQHANLENEHAVLRRQYTDLKRRYADLEIHHASLKSQHADLENQHDNLKREHANRTSSSSSVNRFQCGYCPYKTDSRSYLETHFKLEHKMFYYEM